MRSTWILFVWCFLKLILKMSGLNTPIRTSTHKDHLRLAFAIQLTMHANTLTKRIATWLIPLNIFQQMYMIIQPKTFTHVKISFFRINASKGRKTSWWKVKHSNRQCNCHLCVFNYNVNNYVPVTTYQYQYNTVTVLLSQWLFLGCVWFLHLFSLYIMAELL